MSEAFEAGDRVLLVDRMSPADRLRNKTALGEMIEDYKERQAQV